MYSRKRAPESWTVRARGLTMVLFLGSDPLMGYEINVVISNQHFLKNEMKWVRGQ